MAHIKNVDSFEKLLAICTGYGGQYNPGQQNLQVASLSSMLDSARIALRQVIEAQADFENTTNSREVAFGKLDKLATRILGELSASGALAQTIADARSVIRKMTGRKQRERMPVPSGNAELSASSVTVTRTRGGGKDFATKEYLFEQLLQTLASEPLYQPQVEDLTVQSLRNRLAALRYENASVARAIARLSKARRDRNALLYQDGTNLYDTAQAVKQQVKAIYGYGGDAHRAASSIRFTRPVQ